MTPRLASLARGKRGVVWALFFMLTSASVAAAQGARVHGVVLDAQERPVPGVTVTVTGPGTNLTTVTDASGSFSVDVSMRGRYEVRAELFGFPVETGAETTDATGTAETRLLLRPNYTETVIVTASRSAETLANAPATVTVIPSREIEARAADDVGDLFAGTAGLNATRLNARDMSFDFRTASGILARSQLVLIDGRVMNSEGFGIVLWDLLPVQFEDIAQVELIGTPGSAVWGANALTGVINIRTKSPSETPGGMASVGFGNVGVRHGRVRWADARGRMSYRVSASSFHEDSWERDPLLPDGSPMPNDAKFPNQGTTQTKVNGRVDWQGKLGHLWSAYGELADSSGIVFTPTGPNALADSGSYSTFAGLTYSSDPVEAKIYWNQARGDTVSVLFGDDFHATANTIVGDVVGRRALGARHALSVGGTVTLSGFDLTLAPGDSFRSAVGGFAEDQIALTPKATWTIGARVDKFDTMDVTVSPRTSLVFRPAPRHAVRVAFNRAYRAPSLIENFASTRLDTAVPIIPGLPPVVFSTLVTGNRDLHPETSRAFEVGLTSSIGSRTSVSATAYVNSTRDFVRFYTVESYGPSLPPPGWPLPAAFVPVVPKTLTWLNVGTVRNAGMELTGRVELPYRLSARGSYSYQSDPVASRLDPRFPLVINRPPTNMINGGLIYSGARWQGSVDASYVDEAYWSDILDARFWGWTRSFFLLNARVGYPLRGTPARVSVSATNLLDRRIKQHVFGDIIGRKLSAEVRYRF
jgi:iron complex outermembrane receptor protein